MYSLIVIISWRLFVIYIYIYIHIYTIGRHKYRERLNSAVLEISVRGNGYNESFVERKSEDF